MQQPQQSPNVYTEVLNDEVCLYDRARRTVHSLNPSLARVWNMCDGQTSPAAMAERLRTDLAPELTTEQSEALVWSALRELSKARLLDSELTVTPGGRALTRRQMMKIGIVAGLVPVLHSIVAPSPAAAQSGAPPGIVLYQANNGAEFDGNLGGRTGADALCAASPNRPAGFSNYRALISVSASDEVQDMPANYGVPTNLPITGPAPGFTQIASDWANLLDGGIDASLDAAGVIPGDHRWWSGSSSTGVGSSSNCSGWTTNSDSDEFAGVGGRSTLTNGGWISDFTVPCSVNNRRVVCIAY